VGGHLGAAMSANTNGSSVLHLLNAIHDNAIHDKASTEETPTTDIRFAGRPRSPSVTRNNVRALLNQKDKQNARK
jgi:hypothetical protein